MDRPLPPELIARFRAELERLGFAGQRLGVAVSGGPDSLALLLLAHAMAPDRVEAATVDHGLREESAAEAAMVAGVCASLGVAHETLRVEVAPGNLQDAARSARYDALGEWCARRGLAGLMTAHHADDQAETLLMRLNRGSGIGGLAGIRAISPSPSGQGTMLRPLLGWRRAELQAIVELAGMESVSDPSNTDDRFDRARMRKALADSDWLDVAAIVRSAENLADAEMALADWADREWNDRADFAESEILLDAAGALPRAIMLRLLQRAIRELGGDARGSQVAALLESLQSGRGGNLAGVMVTPESGKWRLRREPARRI